MFNMESELVNAEFVKSSSSYNIKEGVHGGWDYVNEMLKDDFDFRKLAGSLGGKATAKRLQHDPNLAKEHSNQASVNIKASHVAGNYKYAPTFCGKKHSAETKARIGKTNSVNQQGEKNSQFGTMWITNQISNRKILKDAPIPEGW